MFDILVYLFENYVNFADFSEIDTELDSANDSSLSRKLAAVGFAEDEITEALSWLQGLAVTEVQPSLLRDSRSLRAYTQDEMNHLGGEPLGFLHFLEQAGVIAADLRELVIERAMALTEDHLTLGRFKVIVLMVLWSRGQHLNTLVVEELLSDADPELLH